MKIFAEINMQQATYKPKCDSIKLRIPRFKALTGTEKRGRKLGLALMQKYVSQWSKKVLGSYSNSCLTLRFHKIIFIIISTVLKAKNLKTWYPNSYMSSQVHTTRNGILLPKLF